MKIVKYWLDLSTYTQMENVEGGENYEPGWYGCRWGKDEINPLIPNDEGSGECFGFAQFIGYLLSGSMNPHSDWIYYESLGYASGLRVGDIIRIEYEAEGKYYQHSAVVYEVGDGEVRFLQASGSRYNLIRAGQGYYDGYLYDEQSISVIARMPGLRIYRSLENLW